MALEVKVPVLPESVSDATIATWHKKAGDAVKRDENLVDLETDKVVLEVPAQADGVLKEIRKETGATVTSQEILAIIEEGATAAAAPAAAAKAEAPKPAAATPGPQPSAVNPASQQLSPAGQRVAIENKIDPAQVAGTGRGGQVTKEDLVNFMRTGNAATAKAPAPSSPQPSALSPDQEASDTAQLAAMQRFDALTVCSSEDAALLPGSAPVTLIGNGATDRRHAYRPSPDSPRLLFMGPFRYAPNRDGILEFLASAWPALRSRFPDLVLTILGGAESAEVAAAEPNLRQPGVELITAFVDPASYLDQCTLTINPQRDIRGSSIKLIESLLAGRVCVSTSDGARGFSDCGLEGLVLAPAITAMQAPIAALLDDHGERHRRERCDDARLDAFTWNTMADRQFDLYRRLLDRPETQ